MKRSVPKFRLLVVLGTLIYLGWFFLPYGSGLRSDQEAVLISHHGYGAILPYNWMIDGSLFLLWLFSAIGLYFFQNWARHLFLVLTVAGYTRVVLGGIAISPGFDAMLVSLIATIDGAILALAYFSTLTTEFESRSIKRSESK